MQDPGFPSLSEYTDEALCELERAIKDEKRARTLKKTKQTYKSGMVVEFYDVLNTRKEGAIAKVYTKVVGVRPVGKHDVLSVPVDRIIRIVQDSV